MPADVNEKLYWAFLGVHFGNSFWKEFRQQVSSAGNPQIRWSPVLWLFPSSEESREEGGTCAFGLIGSWVHLSTGGHKGDMIWDRHKGLMEKSPLARELTKLQSKSCLKKPLTLPNDIHGPVAWFPHCFQIRQWLRSPRLGSQEKSPWKMLCSGL